jgi:hypothetical protein
MSSPKTAPYGSWQSPITSDLIVAESISLYDVLLDGDNIYWLEGRPTEAGRYVLVRRGKDGTTADVNSEPLNARTRVHEYGGGSVALAGGVAYCSHFEDQRLYRLAPGQQPVALTPAPPDPEDKDTNLRYADGFIDSRRRLWVGVREDHLHPAPSPNTPPGTKPQAVNTLVAIDLATGGTGTVLVQGNDFYSSPCMNSDGRSLAWLTWNHPNMPWVGTELWMAEFTGAGVANPVRIAGGPAESIFQPEWAPDGRLYFISDRSGWWNLYRREANGATVPVCPRKAEFGHQRGQGQEWQICL